MDFGAAAQSLGNLEWGPKWCKTLAVLGWHPGNETAAKDSAVEGTYAVGPSSYKYSKVRVIKISAKSK